MLSSLAGNFPQPSVGIQTEYLGHSQRGKDTWTIMDWLMECWLLNYRVFFFFFFFVSVFFFLLDYYHPSGGTTLTLEDHLCCIYFICQSSHANGRQIGFPLLSIFEVSLELTTKLQMWHPQFIFTLFCDFIPIIPLCFSLAIQWGNRIRKKEKFVSKTRLGLQTPP